MSAHSTGSWRQCKPDCPCHLVMTADGAVAQVFCAKDATQEQRDFLGKLPDHDEAEANTTLIAATDDMLAVCKAIMDRGAAFYDGVFHCWLCEAQTTKCKGERDDLMDAVPIFDDPEHPHDEGCPYPMAEAVLANLKGQEP